MSDPDARCGKNAEAARTTKSGSARSESSDRGVVRDPHDLRSKRRVTLVRDKCQSAAGESFLNEVLQPWLLDGRNTRHQQFYPLWIGILADYVVAGSGQAGSRHGAKVPEAGDADPHRGVAVTDAAIHGHTGPGVQPAMIMTSP